MSTYERDPVTGDLRLIDGPGVTSIKGASEKTYRSGDINITQDNIIGTDSSSDIVDADLFISKEENGWVKKTAEKIWNYIKGKIQSVLGLTAETYDGNAATATTAEKVKGTYSGNGGQQAPNYFGKNKVGFLMSNVPTCGDTHYKNLMYMDNYSGNDVGGVTALGLDRMEPKAFILQSDANRSAWNNIRELLTSSEYPTTGVRYGGTATTTKIKIKINSTTSWMLCFTVTLYQGYRATKLMISGYNYGVNHWYQPEAMLIADSDWKTSIPVYFGYDGTGQLWVGFDGGNYTGVAISDVVNGYTQINDYSGLFTISNVSSLATLQTTYTAVCNWEQIFSFWYKYNDGNSSKRLTINTAVVTTPGNIEVNTYGRVCIVHLEACTVKCPNANTDYKLCDGLPSPYFGIGAIAVVNIESNNTTRVIVQRGTSLLLWTGPAGGIGTTQIRGELIYICHALTA